MMFGVPSVEGRRPRWWKLPQSQGRSPLLTSSKGRSLQKGDRPRAESPPSSIRTGGLPTPAMPSTPDFYGNSAPITPAETRPLHDVPVWLRRFAKQLAGLSMGVGIISGSETLREVLGDGV